MGFTFDKTNKRSKGMNEYEKKRANTETQMENFSIDYYMLILTITSHDVRILIKIH